MKKAFRVLMITLTILVILAGCTSNRLIENKANILSSEKLLNNDNYTIKSENITQNTDRQITKTIPNISDQSTSYMKIHFIDVGQADCTLIDANGTYMLVDAGNNEDSELIITYLKNIGVSRLEYVIGTHPHEDHIGSLDAIINTFEIGKVILPDVLHTSVTFEELLDAIGNKGLKITKPIVGQSYEIGKANFTIIAPNTNYGDELNNWSVGIKIVNGNHSIVMCGDAEEKAEIDMLANDINIGADILKVSHHGSQTSSSDDFIEAINPTYAVISTGLNNDYGHPHKEILTKLKSRGITVYRTDMQGTIIATSDGTNITWHTALSNNDASTNNNQKQDVNTNIYILNTNTKKFHYEDCPSAGKIAESNREVFVGVRAEVIDKDYEPCGYCNP